MGGVFGSPSEPVGARLRRAEAALLESGLRSWRDALVGRRAGGAIAAFDVPLESVGTPLSMHTVWCAPKPAISEADGEVVQTSREDMPFAEAKARLATVADGGAPVVLLHGYGSGIGIFHAILPGLASAVGQPVLAVDSVGCGLSARPQTPIEADARGVYGSHQWGEATPAQAESWFVDGLEKWRKQMGFERVRLVGHSIGGYLSVCYAEAHPERVESLVLIGCAGVPRPPDDVEERITRRWPVLGRLAVAAWTYGWSPMNMPALLISRFFNWYAYRWTDRTWVDDSRLENYLEALWTDGDPSAGAYAHCTLLSLGAYAKGRFLADRIPDLSIRCKVSFIYGVTDWMRPQNAINLREELRQRHRYTGPSVEVGLVNNAGHNVPLEAPTGLVDALAAALDPTGQGIDNRSFYGSDQPIND